MTTVFFGVTTRSYHFSHTIGRLEVHGPGFRHPMDVALGQDGLLYVVSRSRQGRVDGVRTTICTMDEDYLGEFAFFGEEDGQICWAQSVDVDRDGNVYIVDQWLNRISIFNKSGEFLDKWGLGGAGDGQLNQPSGISFDGEDNAYVVDGHNNRVQKFTKDGRFQLKWGEFGSGPGQFNFPWGIEVDHKGDVYVADWRNDRIQKFTGDGEFLAEFGSTGSGVGEFNRPTGVAVDRDGDIYVADWGNNRVEVLTSEGRHVTSLIGHSNISKWAQDKLDANPDMTKQRFLARDMESEMRFWNPVAIEVDDQGRILVADCSRHRVQVYQKETY